MPDCGSCRCVRWWPPTSRSTTSSTTWSTRRTVSEPGPISSVPMTTGDGTRSAFFAPDGDVFVPAPIARGPWGQTISGNYLGGLLGYVLERDAAEPDFQPARLTVDL